MNEINFLELCERYLNNTLSQEEAMDFEYLIASDPLYKAQFIENKQLFSALNAAAQKKNTLTLLNEAHNEAKSTKPANFFYAKMPKIAFQYSIAAAISVLAVIGTLYLSGFFHYEREHGLTYQKLKNEISHISKNQQSMWGVIFSNEQSEENTISSGTCIAISSNGYLLTSYHVVKGSHNISICNETDTINRYNVDLVYHNSVTDIAVLKVSDTTFSGFGRLPVFFSKNPVDLGEYVFTLGYSKKDIVFGEGSVASLSGFEEDSLTYQVSVPANPGNSGGPIINNNGELIGLLCARNIDREGAAFAIKSLYITSVIDSLTNDTTLEKPIISNLNSIKRLKRNDQIRKLKPYIFKVEAY